MHPAGADKFDRYQVRKGQSDCLENWNMVSKPGTCKKYHTVGKEYTTITLSCMDSVSYRILGLGGWGGWSGYMYLDKNKMPPRGCKTLPTYSM